ncbi:MAG: hypothetical protein AAB446_03270 [Patescibacteria group bacterium]
MPRIQFSDVTPPERRSIRDIPIPRGGKRKVPTTIIRQEEPAPTRKEVPSENFPISNPVSNFNKNPVSNVNINKKISDVTEKKTNSAYEYYYPKEKIITEQSVHEFTKNKKKAWIFGSITVIVIAIFIVSMMTVFASATIDITPKNQDINVDMKIAGSVEAGSNIVRYEIIKLSKSDTASVPATGEQAVELKASGKIVIYNNFSTEPQRLIVRTRFENSEGLIYRIPESVVVPGKTVKDGVETPGSIETTVFADEAGDKYNIKKSDFTIPGFKNDANRYKNFYARSSSSMSGGFVGMQKTVLPADKQTALQTIETETDANLKKELETKVPEGLVMLPDSIKFKSTELPIKDSGSSVIIGKEITAYAVMLNAEDLSKVIIEEYISKLPEWNNIKPTIKDFSLLNMTGLPENLETNGKINLQIKGLAKIWADIDVNSISQKLLGAPKQDASKLLDEFAGISTITSTIRPIWKQTFPKDSAKIHVKTTLNQ